MLSQHNVCVIWLCRLMSLIQEARELAQGADRLRENAVQTGEPQCFLGCLFVCGLSVYACFVCLCVFW
jgi:hypothetical protein